MDKRVSVSQRLAEDRSREKRGVEALFAGIPAQHQTVIPAKTFEKATFYFEPEDLAQLERLWLRLMEQGIKCNKSEIMSLFLRRGLKESQDISNSTLVNQLTGKRKRR